MMTRFACLSTAMLLLFALTSCSKEQPAKPAAAKPDATKPAAAKPEAAKPEAAKPAAAKPEAAKPEAAKPAAAKPEAAKPEAAKPEAAKPAVPATDDKAAVEAKLAKADAFDGKTDKIVSKCPSCKLQMDGKSEFAAQVSGYTLHFCSEKCKGEFTKDTTKSIKELVIPGS